MLGATPPAIRSKCNFPDEDDEEADDDGAGDTDEDEPPFDEMDDSLQEAVGFQEIFFEEIESSCGEEGDVFDPAADGDEIGDDVDG